MKKFLTVVLLVTAASAAFSFDLSFYNSFETLCMGEAFTAIANDMNALSYNPAGLTNAQGFVIGLPKANINMTYGAASATIKALTHINEIENVLQSNNNLEIAKYFIDNYGEALSGRNEMVTASDAYLGYSGKKFAIMAFGMGQGYAISFVSNDLIPFVSLHAAAAAYGGISGAIAVNLGDTKLSVGGTYRYGYVAPNIYDIENQSVLTLSSSSLQPNLEYFPDSNWDLGVQFSWKGLRIGGLWHDVNATNSNVRIGIGYSSHAFTADVDFEKLFNNEYSFFRRLHIGLSYSPVDFLHIYGGLSAGWFTGGMKLNIGPLSLCIGSYVLNYGYTAGYDSQRFYTLSFGI